MYFKVGSWNFAEIVEIQGKYLLSSLNVPWVEGKTKSNKYVSCIGGVYSNADF